MPIPLIPRLRPGAVFLLAVAATTLTRAQLRWENPVVEREAALGDESAAVAFRFTNAGPRTVVISEIRSDCSCAVAALEKRSFASGESGEIKASFQFGGRTGQHTRTFFVTTDDAPQTPTALTFKIKIPALIELSAMMMVWRRDEAPVPKSVTISAGTETQIAVQSVQSSNPEFVVRIVPDEPGRRYRVEIKPATTSAPMSATIRMNVEAVLGRPEAVQVFAIVR